MTYRKYRGMSDNDIARSVSHFQHAFRQKTQHMGRVATKGTDLYTLQVELCYLIHELQTTFKHNHQRVMSRLNEFIDNLPKEKENKK